MRRRRLAIAAWLLQAAPIAVTIYTSLPFDRYDRVQTNDIVAGERLALAQAGNEAGACQVKLRRLDDSTAAAGMWDPAETAQNARTAAQDESSIAYIGEYNSGASAVSLPITNSVGLLQVSPTNTYLGLTKRAGGRQRNGEPDKYYPIGRRTFARVAPADHIQAGALAEWMNELHVKRLYVAYDENDYGTSQARLMVRAARRNGIRVVGNVRLTDRARSFRPLARKVRRSRATAFFFGGPAAANAARIYRAVHARSRRIALFGSDGVADRAFTRALPAGAQRRMHITMSTVAPSDYPPAAQQFYTDFKAAYGHMPQPYAIYGYEAMALVLDGMRRAGPDCGNRRAVGNQVFQTRGRESVLGTYSIDLDGDVTTSLFGRYGVRAGRLVYEQAVQVKRDAYGHALGR